MCVGPEQTWKPVMIDATLAAYGCAFIAAVGWALHRFLRPLQHAYNTWLRYRHIETAPRPKWTKLFYHGPTKYLSMAYAHTMFSDLDSTRPNPPFKRVLYGIEQALIITDGAVAAQMFAIEDGFVIQKPAGLIEIFARFLGWATQFTANGHDWVRLKRKFSKIMPLHGTYNQIGRAHQNARVIVDIINGIESKLVDWRPLARAGTMLFACESLNGRLPFDNIYDP